MVGIVGWFLPADGVCAVAADGLLQAILLTLAGIVTCARSSMLWQHSCVSAWGFGKLSAVNAVESVSRCLHCPAVQYQQWC